MVPNWHLETAVKSNYYTISTTIKVKLSCCSLEDMSHIFVLWIGGTWEGRSKLIVKAEQAWPRLHGDLISPWHPHSSLGSYLIQKRRHLGFHDTAGHSGYKRRLPCNLKHASPTNAPYSSDRTQSTSYTKRQQRSITFSPVLRNTHVRYRFTCKVTMPVVFLRSYKETSYRLRDRCKQRIRQKARHDGRTPSKHEMWSQISPRDTPLPVHGIILRALPQFKKTLPFTVINRICPSNTLWIKLFRHLCYQCPRIKALRGQATKENGLKYVLQNCTNAHKVWSTGP